MSEVNQDAPGAQGTTQPAPADQRTQPPAARFTGGPAGAYLLGVPARDLSIEDWAELSDEQRAAVRASGLYATEQGG